MFFLISSKLFPMEQPKTFIQKMKNLTPFWIFLILFKLAAGLHYTMMAPLGAKVFPVWLVGILIGASAFIQLCLDVPAGYISDKFGYKNMLAVTTVFFIAGSVCFLFGLDKVTFILSLAISILGWQFFSSGTNAYTITHSNEKTVGRLISAKDVFASMGIVIASATVIFAVSWRVQFLGMVFIGIFLLALIVLAIAPADAPKKPEHDHMRRKKLHPKFFKEAWKAARDLKPASYLLMITSFTGSTFYAIIWFVVPLLIATEVHNGTLGLGLGVFDFSVVILGFFLGKIVDSFDKKLLVLFGIIIFAVAGILLGSNFGPIFLLLGFIATSGDELTGLSLWAWLYSIDTKHEHYGLITGMIDLFEDMGWTVGPILAGILYIFIGPSWTIAVGGILILLNLIVYVIIIGFRPLNFSTKNIPAHHERRVKHKH